MWCWPNHEFPVKTAVKRLAPSEDLVILLTDNEGVVTDDITVSGEVGKYEVVHDCNNDVVPSLITAGSCAKDGPNVNAVKAWLPQGGKLVQVQEDVSCFCWDSEF